MLPRPRWSNLLAFYSLRQRLARTMSLSRSRRSRTAGPIDARVSARLAKELSGGALVISLLAAASAFAGTERTAQPVTQCAPGRRVLLDAHNSYPESGRWADRIDRALSNGLPLAIEQDLYWRRTANGAYAPVVAHDSDATDGAPTLDAYFFTRIRPLMEQALRENRRETWPLIVLNLDFKTNERAQHIAVLQLLAKYDAWLTVAPRTATPATAAPLVVGPLLVLSGQDSTQRRDFSDSVRVGDKLRVFGAIPVPAAPGSTREERARNLVQMTPAQLIAPAVSNYARWVNFPWSVVEEGGQKNAGQFTADDSVRLQTLVDRAHHNGLFIRFYTLDGYAPAENRGYTADYNFGTRDKASLRWSAVINAGVDFVATDQYEEFGALLKRVIKTRD